jgi:hypothetical protein
MSDIIMKASDQWRNRPADERYTSLDEMLAHFEHQRSITRQGVVPSKVLEAVPSEDGVNGLQVYMAGSKTERKFDLTHHSFQQLATTADAPASYLRKLPAVIAADNINYGLKFLRSVEDVGIMLHDGENPELRAITGPKYGRIFNADVVKALTNRFGNGIEGNFRVPGEFGRDVEVNKRNTTLYASDHDMFVFLADEKNRIEIPDRRDGKPGLLARGFFVWNSEVGDKTFGLSTFLFDYVCSNRIVWGAEHYAEVKIRHSSSAPTRFIEEMAPAMEALSNASTHSITKAITDARNKKLGDDVQDFLAKRFGKRMVAPLQAIHEAEEGRPIENLWDVTTAATAYAKRIEFTDNRVAFERTAGDVLKLVAE